MVGASDGNGTAAERPRTAEARCNERGNSVVRPLELPQDDVLPENDPKERHGEDAEKVGVVHPAPAGHRNRVAHVLRSGQKEGV